MEQSTLVEKITQLVIEELKNNNKVSLDNLFAKAIDENEGSSKQGESEKKSL
ncbi:hypothetical protein H9X78_00055 [Clostridium saudiense]|nr:hypothetical protein [Clostridium saudiense]MBM6858903.1 hypothetical protein [Clostridium saudiense]